MLRFDLSRRGKEVLIVVGSPRPTNFRSRCQPCAFQRLANKPLCQCLLHACLPRNTPLQSNFLQERRGNAHCPKREHSFCHAVSSTRHSIPATESGSQAVERASLVDCLTSSVPARLLVSQQSSESTLPAFLILTRRRRGGDPIAGRDIPRTAVYAVLKAGIK